MTMSRSCVLLLSLLTLAVSGCATTGGPSDAERLALYRSHAGEPVNSFRFTGTLLGWTELGDTALAVQTKPRESWLLELNGPCQNLEYAMSIGLTSRMNQVNARFDKVLVRDGMPGGCHIASIRPLDMQALKEDLSRLRELSVEERAEDGPAS